MRYLESERFIVQSSSKESLRNYRDGWERTFGEKEPASEPSPLPRECSGGYYVGVDDTGDPIGYSCTEQDGCGLEGCPSRA